MKDRAVVSVGGGGSDRDKSVCMWALDHTDMGLPYDGLGVRVGGSRDCVTCGYVSIYYLMIARPLAEAP